MSELEKMRRGELYDYSVPEVQRRSLAARRALRRFNHTPTDEPEALGDALAALIPGVPRSATVVPPFFCDLGFPIRLGEEVFVNANCTFLDCGGITIGAHTLIGPNCQLYTPQHPTDHIERRRPVERGLPISIGEDCWLGGGVIVCPGVRIGNRTIVGAGSVVVHDLPDDVVAAGNPAEVKRKLR